MRHCLFEVIDHTCAELNQRLANNEKLLLTCDTLKPDSQLFLNINQMTIVCQSYPFLGIKDEKLQAEVTVAKEMLLEKKVISADDVLNILYSVKIAFPNLIKICQFILTLPVSLASAECSFSTIKR